MKDKIEDYIEGDSINIEEIIENYKNYIHSVILRNSYGALNKADIEEAASDVYISIWKNKDKLREVTSLNSYIGTISKNVTYDLLRKNKKFQNEIELTDDLNISTDNIDTSVGENELKEVIREELENIDELDYKIFRNYYYLSKTVKEIAKEFNLKETTVKVKLHRMRKRLKIGLENRGIHYACGILIALIIFVLGVIYSNEIIAFIKNMFINSSKGVDTAIDNGYIQENLNDSSTSNGVKVSVDTILIDDYNLCILFKISSKDIDLNNLKEIEVPNLIITDENNKLIVNKNEEDDNLNVNDVNRYSYHGISNDSEDWKITSTYDDGITLSYNTHSDKFPKSKELNIMLNTINLIYKDNTESKIKGDWNIHINLPKEYSNRENILYTFSNITNDVILEYAKVSNTGCSIRLNLKCLDEDVKNSNEEIIKEIYIENENGEKFYPSRTADTNGGSNKLNTSDDIIIEELFNYTTYDVTDNAWIHIIKNELFFSDGGEIVIELKRK